MIYLKSTIGVHLLILEPGNLKHIQEGGIATSPNKEVAVAYTPDVLWVVEQLKFLEQGESLDVETMAKILEAGKEREPVFERPYHEYINLSQKENKNAKPSS